MIFIFININNNLSEEEVHIKHTSFLPKLIVGRMKLNIVNLEIYWYEMLKLRHVMTF